MKQVALVLFLAAALVLACGALSVAQRVLVNPVSVRSETVPAVASEKRFNFVNFAGLYYDIDGDVGVDSETITVRIARPGQRPEEREFTGRGPLSRRATEDLPRGEIPAGEFQYLTLAREVPLSLDDLRGLRVPNAGCHQNHYVMMPFLGKPRMALAGIPAKTAPVVYQMPPGQGIQISDGVTWNLPDEFSLTVNDVARDRGEARLRLAHRGEVVAEARVRVGGEPAARLMTWYRNALDERGVLWFTAFASQVGEKDGRGFVTLRRVWLCGWEPTRYEQGTRYGRLGIQGISQRAIELRNPEPIAFTYGSVLRLAGDLWFEVGDDNPFRWMLVRQVVPTVEFLPDGASFVEAPAPAAGKPPLLESRPAVDVERANEVAHLLHMLQQTPR